MEGIFQDTVVSPLHGKMSRDQSPSELVRASSDYSGWDPSSVFSGGGIDDQDDNRANQDDDQDANNGNWDESDHNNLDEMRNTSNRSVKRDERDRINDTHSEDSRDRKEDNNNINHDDNNHHNIDENNDDDNDDNNDDNNDNKNNNNDNKNDDKINSNPVDAGIDLMDFNDDVQIDHSKVLEESDSEVNFLPGPSGDYITLIEHL